MIGKIFLLSEVCPELYRQVWREEYSFQQKRKIVHKARLADCKGHVSYSRKAGKGEEGVFSSFPTLTGKGWRNLLTTAFLQVGFFLVISTKNKSPLIGRNCHCRPWHGVGDGYKEKKTCSQCRDGRSVALV